MENVFQAVFDYTTIVDEDNFYRGHIILKEKRDLIEKCICGDLNKARMLCSPETFCELETLSLRGLQREYFEAQKQLADKYLFRKRVRVLNGLVKANAKADDFSVYWVGEVGWFHSQQEKQNILVELAYGPDSLGCILITEDTKIQILGDI